MAILVSFTDTVREILYMRYKERKIKPHLVVRPRPYGPPLTTRAAYIYYYGEQ